MAEWELVTNEATSEDWDVDVPGSFTHAWIAEDGRPVAAVIVEGIDEDADKTLDERIALITASQDLRDACEAARIELMWLIQQVKATPNGSVDRAYQKCKAALAKATGKSFPDR